MKLMLVTILALPAFGWGGDAFAGSNQTKRLSELLKSEKQMRGVLEGSSGWRLEEVVAFCRTALFKKQRIGSGQPGTHYVRVFPQSSTLVLAAIRRLRREEGKPDCDLLAEYVAMAATGHNGNQKLVSAVSNARSTKHSSRTDFALSLAVLHLSESSSEAWVKSWVRVMTRPLPVGTNLTDSSLYERLSVHDGKTVEKIWKILTDRWKKAGAKGKDARKGFAWRVHMVSAQYPKARILDAFVRKSPELLKLCMESYSHSTSREFRHTVLNAITDSMSTFNALLDAKEREAFVRKVADEEDDPRLRQDWQRMLEKIERLKKEEKAGKKKRSK